MLPEPRLYCRFRERLVRNSCAFWLAGGLGKSERVCKIQESVAELGEVFARQNSFEILAFLLIDAQSISPSDVESLAICEGLWAACLARSRYDRLLPSRALVQ